MTQIEYIAILFNDVGFPAPYRRVWLRREFGKSYPNELTMLQRSMVIVRLKLIKRDRGDGNRYLTEWRVGQKEES